MLQAGSVRCVVRRCTHAVVHGVRLYMRSHTVCEKKNEEKIFHTSRSGDSTSSSSSSLSLISSRASSSAFMCL